VLESRRNVNVRVTSSLSQINLEKQLNLHIPDISGTNKAGGSAVPRMNFAKARLKMK